MSIHPTWSEANRPQCQKPTVYTGTLRSKPGSNQKYFIFVQVKGTEVLYGILGYWPVPKSTEFFFFSLGNQTEVSHSLPCNAQHYSLEWPVSIRTAQTEAAAAARKNTQQHQICIPAGCRHRAPPGHGAQAWHSTLHTPNSKLSQSIENLSAQPPRGRVKIQGHYQLN